MGFFFFSRDAQNYQEHFGKVFQDQILQPNYLLMRGGDSEKVPYKTWEERKKDAVKRTKDAMVIISSTP